MEGNCTTYKCCGLACELGFGPWLPYSQNIFGPSPSCICIPIKSMVDCPKPQCKLSPCIIIIIYFCWTHHPHFKPNKSLRVRRWFLRPSSGLILIHCCMGVRKDGGIQMLLTFLVPNEEKGQILSPQWRCKIDWNQGRQKKTSKFATQKIHDLCIMDFLGTKF